MKKLFNLLILTVLLASCSDLSKKIVLTEYGGVLKSLSKSHTEYTRYDFKLADYLMNAVAFQALSSGNSEIDMTYKELLDRAHEKNKGFYESLDLYNKEAEGLYKLADVAFTQGEYEHTGGDSHAYYFYLKIKNKKEKDIARIKGTVEIFNKNGEMIFDSKFQYKEAIPANSETEAVGGNYIRDNHDLATLKDTPVKKLIFKWYPEEIVYTDGEEISTPGRPIYEDLF
ncbi:MAG: hypothetical protein N4A49_11435 [Marinifilaceae bacterium]|jgi:hypothetical protein|nr:hypothetical protein [Marinifilaceae bacterium]